MGRSVLVKHRVPKGYRLPELDLEIRSQRTRSEARLLREARALGVPTPIVYDVDLVRAELVMQEIHGRRVKDLLDVMGDAEVRNICREIGRLVALLHGGGMVHGDLTTSNMLHDGARIWFIDLSLGFRNAELEDMGVDLHLLRRAFQSAHSELMDIFPEVLRSYQLHAPDGLKAIERMGEIESRGRYT